MGIQADEFVVIIGKPKERKNVRRLFHFSKQAILLGMGLLASKPSTWPANSTCFTNILPLSANRASFFSQRCYSTSRRCLI